MTAAAALASSELVAAHQVLGDGPGGGDLPAPVAGDESGSQPTPGPLGEPVGAAAQDAADPVERVATMTPMPVDVVLHAAAHLVERGQPELGDMERVEHANRVRELLMQRGGVAAERVQRCGRDLRLPLGRRARAARRPAPARTGRRPRRSSRAGRPGVRSAMPVAIRRRVLSGGAQERSLVHPDRRRRVQPCGVVDDRLAAGDD